MNESVGRAGRARNSKTHVLLSGVSAMRRPKHIVTCGLSGAWQSAIERLFFDHSFEVSVFSSLAASEESLVEMPSNGLEQALVIAQVQRSSLIETCRQTASWVTGQRLVGQRILAVYSERASTTGCHLAIRNGLVACGFSAVIESFGELDRVRRFAKRHFERHDQHAGDASIEQLVAENMPW